MSDETQVRYIKYRNDRKCGPSVPDAIRGSVAWICKNIGMDRPDTSDELVLAIRDQAIEERGAELKPQNPKTPINEKNLKLINKLILKRNLKMAK